MNESDNKWHNTPDSDDKRVGVPSHPVAGALGGDAVANSINPDAEASYWRENYSSRPYVPADAKYDDFGPAYAFGISAYKRHAGRNFDDIESELSSNWAAQRGQSRLEWLDARDATHDAWHRLMLNPMRAGG